MMNSFLLRNKRKKGAALTLESIFYLTMIGLFLAGVAFGISSMMRQMNINKVTETMSAIQSSIYSIYAMDSDYSGLTVERVISGGHIPNSSINKDRKGLRSNWGGILVEPDTSDGGSPNDTFRITLKNIPESVCQKLGTNIKASEEWQSVQINSSTYDADEDREESITDFVFDNCKTGSGNELIYLSRVQ